MSITDLHMTVSVRARDLAELVHQALAECRAVADAWEDRVSWTLESVTARPGEAGLWWADVALVGAPA